MKFSKDYSKLDKNTFTTIRRASNYYRICSVYKIKTPTKEFKAMIVAGETIVKKDMTEELARSDADCSRKELITMLEKWYGKKFDDFVLFTLERQG